ncbi:MAG: PIN domain-containing protein [Planctomycetia bacterium]|nr:PIN domain-containing protein [Planctomycetia bacterium]
MSDRPGVAVFDTNVLVAGFLNPHGAPGRIVEWLRSGAVRAGLDDRIISEYEEVLARREFALPRHEVSIVLRRIRSQAEYAVVSPSHVVRGLPDADDAPFAECALALVCPLVSGNTRHFPAAAIGTLTILTPRQFVDAHAKA